jgi:hypothetical protein
MILLQFQRRKPAKIFHEIDRADPLAYDFSKVAATTPQQPTGIVSNHPFSYVLLDNGFDELPALSILCSRHPKTICFYKYWGAVSNVEAFVSESESLAASSI